MTTDLAAPLLWGRRLLVLLATTHVAIPLVMVLDRDGLVGQIATQHPEFDAVTVTAAEHVALASASAFHLVLAGVAVALAVRLPRGGRRFRRVLVVSQVLATLAGIVSWSSSPMFHVLIPVVTAVEIVLIVLVTVPQDSRHQLTRAG